MQKFTRRKINREIHLTGDEYITGHMNFRVINRVKYKRIQTENLLMEE